MDPSTTPPKKYNPYYLPKPEGCDKQTDCPYQSMPQVLQPSDFGSTTMMEFSDSYCSTCKRGFKPVPPPEPPKPTLKTEPVPVVPWYRKYAWALLLMVALLAGLLYWFWPDSAPPTVAQQTPTPPCPQGEVVAGKDTCVNGISYAVVCNGRGGYETGGRIGKCPGSDEPPIVVARKKTTKPAVVYRPGEPYVVKRNGECRIEVYDAQGRLASFGPVPPERLGECANARPAKKL
ncbi:hypothetical protein [Nibrella viscosa]|uniref:hypothetical protein n=1 Tax=Nibrella viscosa TaxID=1084524 RepID=UPI0031EC5DD1